MRLIDYANELKRNRLNENIKYEYYKRCYEIYDQVGGSRKLLEEASKQEGVSSDTIYRHARSYIHEILKMSNEEYLERYIIPNQKKKVRVTPFNDLLLKLMNEENPDKIIELIQNSGLIVISSSDIADFVHCYFPEKKDYLVESLIAKIKSYKKFKQEEQRKMESQKKQEVINQKLKEKQLYYESENFRLKNFVEGEYDTKESYCETNNFSLKNFERLLEFAKEYDQELYQKYCDKWQLERSQRYAKFTKLTKRLIYLIENGMKCEDDMVRPFDLVDYYQFTKINFDTFIEMLQSINLTKEELKIIRTFIGKNKNNIYTDIKEIEQVIAATQEVGCQKDKNGSLIPGSGRIIELSEKENIINFLKQEQIPLNQRTYTIAFRRYLNGTLFLEKNPSQVRNKKK